MAALGYLPLCFFCFLFLFFVVVVVVVVCFFYLREETNDF